MRQHFVIRLKGEITQRHSGVIRAIGSGFSKVLKSFTTFVSLITELLLFRHF